MKGTRVIVAALMAALLIGVVVAPALAFDGIVLDGRVVFGENFTLESGEALYGDLVVFGGNVTLEDGSQVFGDVVVWGGNVEVSGDIDGDMVCFGGIISLTDTADVEGDVATIGGALDQDSQARVGGSHITGVPGNVWSFSLPTVVSSVTSGATTYWPRYLAWGTSLAVGRMLLMACLGGLVAILWPVPAARVGKAGVRTVLPSMGVGLLTFILGLVLIIGLLITICLSPGAALAGLALGVAMVYGWIALGIYAGERLMKAITPQSVSPFWSAALGTGLLTLLSGLFDLIPCIGWTITFLVACMGLGAVVLTRFGSTSYPVVTSAALSPVEGEPEPYSELEADGTGSESESEAEAEEA